MTMPSKIWVGKAYAKAQAEFPDGYFSPVFSERYIRADIADELARALEFEIKRSRRHLAQSTLDALERYNAIEATRNI